MGYIYRIINRINNKQYIGLTRQLDITHRWQGHINESSGCTLMKQAFKKYGVDNFKFEIIIICFNEDVFKYEKEYIQKFNTIMPNGYNMTAGGEPGGNFEGKKHTEATKQAISLASKKWIENLENRNKVSEGVKKGLANSEKWKKAKEEGRVGTHKYNKQPKSGEVKQKISESLKRFFDDTENLIKSKEKKSRNGRAVYQCTLENTIIKEFTNAAEAGRQVGLNRKNIQANLAGRNKTAGGYIWKYADMYGND